MQKAKIRINTKFKINAKTQKDTISKMQATAKAQYSKNG